MRQSKFAFCFWLLGLLVSASSASAGCFINNGLSGQVLDYRDSLPIEGALVSLYSQCWGCGNLNGELFALTDAEGRFTIADCCTLYYPSGPVGGYVHYYATAQGYDTTIVSYKWDQLGCPDDFDFTFGPTEYTFYLHPQPLSTEYAVDVNSLSEMRLVAFPNPFNLATTISFNLSASAAVDISIIDVSGRRVRLLQRRLLLSGPHEFSWDGRDETGAAAASGVYFCRIIAGGKQHSLKLLLLK